MPDSWLETRIDVPPAMAEAMANHLMELGSPGLAVEESETHTRLIAYFERPEQVEAARRFAAVLVDGARVVSSSIGSEDWAENWKAHFPPLLIGARFYVCPPWAPPAPAGRLPVVIDPGMAFGTGNHATTAGCLELLERHLQPGMAVLDVGTGSGVLAIAALLLGARHATAVDDDPLATAAAAGNAARNGVAERITVLASIDAVAGTYDLGLANIQLNVLCALEERIAARIRPGGVLIASGVLREEADALAARYARHWELGETAGDERWLAVAARRR